MTRANGIDADGYAVRWYEDADLRGFLSLERAVWNRDLDESWFEWKYADNPYVDHVPVFVVERDDEIVGARPFIGFRMRVGDGTVLALQPSDTMVHPNHRRRGLFTRMTRRAMERYADREPAFLFNFPNHHSRPGYLKLGWQIVGERETYYRVQNPTPLMADGGRVPSRAVDLVTTLASRLADRRRSPPKASGAYSVDRYSGVRVETLVDLYESRPPEKVHALRDGTFYRWRFASPAWDRATYVASRSGEPVVGVVARTRTTADGVTLTQLADVVPIVGGGRWETALFDVFERVVRDHADSDLLAVSKANLPADMLAEFGFVGDAHPPLSWVTDTDCKLVTRPFRRGWTVGGTRLSRRSNWHVSFAERDTI